MTSFRTRLVAASLIVPAVAAGCSSGRPVAGEAGGSTELAFGEALIPYERATLATTQEVRIQATHLSLRLLVAHVAAAQRIELARLGDVTRRTLGVAPTPAARAYLKLPLGLVERNWVSVEINHPAAALRSEGPFDQAAIQALFGRYVGALYMARAALGSERDGRLRGLTAEVVSARQRWLARLDSLYARYYGTPVPFE